MATKNTQETTGKTPETNKKGVEISEEKSVEKIAQETAQTTAEETAKKVAEQTAAEAVQKTTKQAIEKAVSEAVKKEVKSAVEKAVAEAVKNTTAQPPAKQATSNEPLVKVKFTKSPFGKFKLPYYVGQEKELPKPLAGDLIKAQVAEKV